MARSFYLELAASGLAMPIGTDLVLHEQRDPAGVLLDGSRLGAVMVSAARRWGTPLALALMDLTLEKDLLLARAGVEAGQRESWHFAEALGEAAMGRMMAEGEWSARMRANLDALRVVRGASGCVGVGMVIGPFSLMTKLIADPITPVFMAGAGVSDDPEVALVEQLLQVGEAVVCASVRAQAAAGAQAIVVAEPAANVAYVSPKQMGEGSDVFERYVMEPNRRVARAIAESGMDLIFHCCGELTAEMVRAFGSLRPAMLSLGSSRRLWEDARQIPGDVVLFGNLPTKKFASEAYGVADVTAMARELRERMRETGHPFVLGSECDVLSVKGAEGRIMEKVEAMLRCARA